MHNSWPKATICHACENTIEQGQWFCKTCGRSRGIGALQFKQWETIVVGVGSFITVCLLVMAVTALAAVITSLRPALTQENPSSRISSPSLVAHDNPPPVTGTKRPTRTPRPTATPEDTDFANYSCPDKSQVNLRVGDRAIIPFYDVNLRSSPKVPDVWDENIVITLHKGDKMSITGGPECAHEGTWWEVKTDSGYTGWVREKQPNKILLEPIK